LCSRIKLVLRQGFISWEEVLVVWFRFKEFVFDGADEVKGGSLHCLFGFGRLLVLRDTLMEEADLEIS
jgi:hypothetical protein